MNQCTSNHPCRGCGRYRSMDIQWLFIFLLWENYYMNICNDGRRVKPDIKHLTLSYATLNTFREAIVGFINSLLFNTCCRSVNEYNYQALEMLHYSVRLLVRVLVYAPPPPPPPTASMQFWKCYIYIYKLSPHAHSYYNILAIHNFSNMLSAYCP